MNMFSGAWPKLFGENRKSLSEPLNMIDRAEILEDFSDNLRRLY